MKRCTRCNQTKPFALFTKDKRNADGCTGWCRACSTEAQREWKHNNRERYNQSVAARRKRMRKEALQAYGGMCDCCGETREEFLAFDHINNDGGEHRRKLSDGSRLYQYLRKEGYPKDRYRVLCHNCNCARGYYGTCPHEKERQAVDSLLAEVMYNAVSEL